MDQSDLSPDINNLPNLSDHNMLWVCVYVTGSDKKGLIAHDRKSNFFTQMQSYMNALLDFSVRHGLCGNWSAAYSWPSGDPYEQWSIHGTMGGQ